MRPQQWEEVLGRPELAALVLQAARRRDGLHWLYVGVYGVREQSTQAAHGLCLASTACRQAVLGAVERATAPGAWAYEHASVLGAMTTLASLRLTGNQGVDPAQLPPLPRLTRLECSLRQGAEAAAAWPRLGGLRQLALEAGAGGGLPPALLQLPHLTRLRARVGCWDALRPIEQLTRLIALEVGCKGDGEYDLHLVHLCSLTSLDLDCSAKYLPEDLAQLSALGSLSLGGCYRLQQLPDNIGQLSALSSLSLAQCYNLQQLPDNIGQLSALTQPGPARVQTPSAPA
jgi:hypothetical protein